MPSTSCATSSCEGLGEKRSGGWWGGEGIGGGGGGGCGGEAQARGLTADASALNSSRVRLSNTSAWLLRAALAMACLVSGL